MEGSGSTPGDAEPGIDLDDDEDYSNQSGDGEIIVAATSQINELDRLDSSKEHSVPQPLMHGFLGGYIAGVATIVLLLIIVALVVYILRKRRQRDCETPDVSVYNQGPREVKGVLEEGGKVTEGGGAGGNVCDEHQYMETSEVRIVSALPPGVYNQGPSEVKGVLEEGGTVTEGGGAGANVCDEHQYMETSEVGIVSALPPGVYQEYNQGSREVQGVLESCTVTEGGGAGGTVCDEHQYMEVKPVVHDN